MKTWSLVSQLMLLALFSHAISFSNPTRNGNKVTLPPCSFPDGIYYQSDVVPNVIKASANESLTLTINGSTEGRYTCGYTGSGGTIIVLRKSQADVMHIIIFHHFRSI